MSPIKDRVLKISESKGISRVDFFNHLGLSYANFKGVQKKSALSSEALANIIASYPEVNPDWLLTGRGAMFRVSQEAEAKKQELAVEMDKVTNTIIDAMEKVIATQEITIRSQEKTITALEKQVQELDVQLQHFRGEK